MDYVSPPRIYVEFFIDLVEPESTYRCRQRSRVRKILREDIAMFQRGYTNAPRDWVDELRELFTNKCNFQHCALNIDSSRVRTTSVSVSYQYAAQTFQHRIDRNSCFFLI